MPGIVGLVTNRPREWAEPQLLRMVETLCHESFYRTGTWCDESLGVYVGWIARAGSFPDGMPVENERADKILVFSGEEYSDPRIIHHLEHNGYRSCGQPGAYLVQRADQDPSFPKSLNGMFHGVLTDRTKGTASLFNDRYGMHPVYYHEAKEAFYFAAEAKAILAVRPELRTPSPQGLGEVVSCGCTLENRTIFKDIFTLPAASAWVFRNAAVEHKSLYFVPREWEEQAPLDPEAYYEELRDVLSRNLDSYFAGPERVGVALTGGMDTRVIMAWHKAAFGSVPCYTFGGMFRASQDVRLAEAVARACHQTHHVITAGDEFLKRFPYYAERSLYLTEGGVDVSRSSDLYVSEKAREIAPVKVVGTYGSETLQHSVMFKPMPPADGVFHPEFLAHTRHAETIYAAIRRVHPVTFVTFRQSPWYHHGILALEQTQLTVRSPFLDNNFVRTVYRAPQFNTEDVRPRLIGDGNPALGRIATDRGAGGALGPSASAIVRGFHEFTFKAEYAYDYGMPQWVARADHIAKSLHLERLFLGRHKFLHYRVWYRDALANYVKEILLDSLTLSRPYLERKSLETIVHSHVKGNRNYTTAIHRLLSLELLHRLFLEARN